jgi:HAD superfamily hydrolase (TIGR01509 family)
MLRALAFDLWETLITDSPELTRQQERLRMTRIEEILTRAGHRDIAGRIENAYRSVWRRCHDLYWSLDRDISCRTQVVHFLEELQLDPHAFSEEDLDAIESAYARAAIEVLPRTVDGAAEMLAAVSARGLRVGLISNKGRTPGYALREILQQLGLAQFLDVMVFSNEHGECKPRLSIFEVLQRGLGTPFQETAFVGDNLHVDVAGAKRAGMIAVHFDPPTRGTAVAPPPIDPEPVVADATITSLAEIDALVARFVSS